MNSNEYNKLADINASNRSSRVQIVTEGGAPFDNTLKITPPGFVSNPPASSGLVIHIFNDSNGKIVIPFQYENELPSNFESNDVGLYDTETQTQTIKVNKDGITIVADSVTIERDDGLGPREIALVGDLTSNGAVITGTP